MTEYWHPVTLIRESEFDQYLSVLDDTLDERIDSRNYEEEFFYEDNGGARAMIGMEQNIYSGLREQLEDFESKTDLFNYVEDEIELSRDSMLPSPLYLLMKPIDRMFESHREMVFQEIFEQAREEFRNGASPESQAEVSGTGSIQSSP